MISGHLPESPAHPGVTRSIGPLGAPPADISLDQRNGRVGVVFLTANRFELWELGSQDW